MWTAINNGLAGKWAKIMALALAAGAAGLAATPAQAGERERWSDRDRGYERDRGHDWRDRRRDDRRVGIDINLRTGRLPLSHLRWEKPCYEERQVKVWIEPVYRTVYDRVWREPVVKVEYERVWVADRYETRWVTRYDRHGCKTRVREAILVEPGHWEERRREVVVKPGCWETIERQEIVSAGHYEWRTERVRVADDGWRSGIGLGLRF